MRNDQVILRTPAEYDELEVIEQEEEAAHLQGMIGPDPTSSSKVKITAPKKCIISIQNR
jgi:hypothetical protein